MITKNGKLFGKINIFDFVALILIIVLIFGVFYKFLVIDKAEKMVDISYNLFIKNVRDVTVNSFSENATIFDYKLDESIGTITKVEKEQAKSIMKLLDGRAINTSVDERYDMTISVKAKAVKQQDGTLIVGKTKIVDGVELKISTQKGNCQATIKEVQSGS